MRKQITLNIKPEILEKVKEVAEKENRSLSQEIEKILKEKYLPC